MKLQAYINSDKSKSVFLYFWGICWTATGDTSEKMNLDESGRRSGDTALTAALNWTSLVGLSLIICISVLFFGFKNEYVFAPSNR